MRFSETYRRRAIQQAYNEEHNITPRGVTKEIKDLTDRVRQVAEENGAYDAKGGSGAGVIAELPREELARIVRDIEGQMKQAAKMLEFEKAGQLRDQIIETPQGDGKGGPRRPRQARRENRRESEATKWQEPGSERGRGSGSERRESSTP